MIKEIERAFSVDTIKYNDEVLWYRIVFSGVEYDKNANRLVVKFDKYYFTNSITKIDDNNLQSSVLWFTASSDKFIENGSYVNKPSELSINEVEFMYNLVFLEKDGILALINHLQQNKLIC